MYIHVFAYACVFRGKCMQCPTRAGSRVSENMFTCTCVRCVRAERERERQMDISDNTYNNTSPFESTQFQ